MPRLSGKIRREIAIACCAAPLLISIAPKVAPAAAPPAAPASRPTELTKAQIDALIDQAGKTPPSWWDSAPLNIPDGMDMTWAPPAPGQARDDKHFLNTYLVADIFPNEDRWQEGVKLVQQSLVLNKDNPRVKLSAAVWLSRIYAGMLQDYPRGAFWARKCGGAMDVTLAECYLKMGCKPMAVELLTKLSKGAIRDPGIIKTWAEAGELEKALSLVDTLAKVNPTQAYLTAAEACRLAGKIPDAITFYQKTIGVGREDKFKERAVASLEAIKLYDSLDLANVPDGTYKNSCLGYSAQVEIAVEVKAHHIVSVKVTQHHEKRFFASIADTTAQIVQKQSVKGIDTTSGATITSEAIINASAKALAAAALK